MGGERGSSQVAALGLALVLATGTPVSAHPHAWITVKSQIAFTPDGKVAAVVHDWVFDEMYSSFATQGLAPSGQLVSPRNSPTSRGRTRAASPTSAISPR